MCWMRAFMLRGRCAVFNVAELGEALKLGIGHALGIVRRCVSAALQCIHTLSVQLLVDRRQTLSAASNFDGVELSESDPGFRPLRF